MKIPQSNSEALLCNRKQTVLTVAASLLLACVGSKSPLIDLSSRDTCAQPPRSPLPSPEVDLELQDKQRGAHAFVR